MLIRTAVTAATTILAATSSLAQPSRPTEGYLDHHALLAEARAIAGAHERCSLEVIGTSLRGREIVLLRIEADGGGEGRPALLVTAGLDGRHLVGSETALRVARRLLEDHADALAEMNVYVVPRANPDGAERGFAEADSSRAGNLRPTDEDHDGVVDEDGPVDLDGNGFITMMRRPNPPLDDRATHLPDPAAPRLLKKADPVKGERPVYAVYTEGLDLDGDGAYAEDAPGTVDIDRNFMHEWPEFDRDAGAYQLSEPESLALAEFVLAHPEIVASVTYGRHDNVVNVPDGKGKDISGRGPKNLDPDDVALYKEIAERFRDLTGQERAKADIAGSFHAWLYAQRGIPSFATVVWGRPDPSEEEEEVEADDAEGAAEAEVNEDPDEAPADEAGETADDDEGAREDEKKERKKEKKEPKPANEEDAAWLTYSDRDRGGAGFVEWTPFDHPTLGAVEIGGFVPGFRMNPPAEMLDDLAEAQTKFVVDLIERRPKLSIDGPEITALAGGLYEIRLGLVNDGYLPTTTAMARKARAIPPTIVRLAPPLERIVAGDRVSRIWGVNGSGGREVRRWIVRTDPGETIEIQIENRQLGDQVVRVVAGE